MGTPWKTTSQRRRTYQRLPDRPSLECLHRLPHGGGRACGTMPSTESLPWSGNEDLWRRPCHRVTGRPQELRAMTVSVPVVAGIIIARYAPRHDGRHPHTYRVRERAPAPGAGRVLPHARGSARAADRCSGGVANDQPGAGKPASGHGHPGGQRGSSVPCRHRPAPSSRGTQLSPRDPARDGPGPGRLPRGARRHSEPGHRLRAGAARAASRSDRRRLHRTRVRSGACDGVAEPEFAGGAPARMATRSG
jgi:hypothetical protein